MRTKLHGLNGGSVEVVAITGARVYGTPRRIGHGPGTMVAVPWTMRRSGSLHGFAGPKKTRPLPRPRVLLHASRPVPGTGG